MKERIVYGIMTALIKAWFVVISQEHAQATLTENLSLNLVFRIQIVSGGSFVCQENAPLTSKCPIERRLLSCFQSGFLGSQCSLRSMSEKYSQNTRFSDSEDINLREVKKRARTENWMNRFKLNGPTRAHAISSKSRNSVDFRDSDLVLRLLN